MAIQSLFDYLKESPSPYHAVAAAARRLEAAGFAPLAEHEAWTLEPGKGYYVTRNQSSLIAFRLPEGPLTGWRITAAHGDAPTFYVKNTSLGSDRQYERWEVEGYGGMNCATWQDRPLGVAGRLVVRTATGVESRLAASDRPVAVIPSLAIHMQRDVNKGHEYNIQRDMQPLAGLNGAAPDLFDALGQLEEGETLLGADLVVFPWQEPCLVGGGLFMAPRIDDQACAWATLEGLLTAEVHPFAGQVYCLFDNEEVGSGTRQGALSSFLPDVLARAGQALGLSDEQRRRALTASFALSADNGHAVHPNFPDKSDPENKVYPNSGVVVKFNAAQKYTSTGLTIGLFRALCDQAGVPTQLFANRADEPGGSTLGHLLGQQVSIPMVDIGMAQLSMHSAVETAGAEDPQYMADACRAFFNSRFAPTADGSWTL